MKNKPTRARKFREYPPVRKVGVSKGHGPRHAENVLEGEEVDPAKLPKFQTGSEAVPDYLPTPPEAGSTRGGRMIEEILRQAREGMGLSDEALAEIKKNPAGMRALASYMQAGIMLNPEFGRRGGGELPGGGGKPGKMPQTPRYEGPEPTKLKGISEMDVKQVKSKWDAALESPQMPPTKEELAGLTPEQQKKVLDDWQKMLDAAEAEHQGTYTTKEGDTFIKLKGTQEPPLDVPPPEEPPFEPNVPRYAKGKVSVAKGYGPRHAENAAEGNAVQYNRGVARLAGGESNLKPGWINDQYALPEGGGGGGVKEWNAGDFEKWIEGQKPSTVASGAPTPIGEVDIPPADLGAPDPGAVLVPPVGEGGGIRGGPFQGWSPEQFNAWHSGVGVGNLGFPSFEGNTAGPGGTQLGYSTTSYDVPGYGFVPHAQLANSMASNNFWDYMNPWGGTSKGGEGTGDPTQRNVGRAVGTATNFFFPGAGYLTGSASRWLTSKIQNMIAGGASKGAIGREIAKAQAKLPPMPSGSVDLPGGGTSTSGGGGYYSPEYLRSIGYGPGQGTGSLWPGSTGNWGYAQDNPSSPSYDPIGPAAGGFGGGIAGGGGSFFHGLGGIRGGPLAGGGSGASGPSNLRWGGAAFGGEGTSDRPHFNPFFGGYNANMPSKGVAVALRAKGDSDLTAKNTDTVPAMLTPREAVLNRNAAELAGRGNIEQLNAEGNKLAEKGVDLAGGKNMKTKAKKYQGGDDMVPLPAKAKNPPYNSIGGGVLGAMPPDQIGGMPQPMRARGREFGQDWISGHPMFHQNWVQDPSGGWMARRGGAGAWGQQHPVAGGGGGGSDAGRPPYPTQVAGGSPYGYNPTSGFPNVPPGGWNASNSGYTPPDNRVRGGGFYPKGMGMQSGSAEVGPIGSPNPQTAYGPPITLSAPQLQQAAQKAGLNAGQIQGLMSAVQGFGQAYSGMSDGLGGGGTGGMDAAGAFQGGISDIGYPPFVAPNAEYHADKGSSWIGRYDPAYTLPIY